MKPDDDCRVPALTIDLAGGFQAEVVRPHKWEESFDPRFERCAWCGDVRKKEYCQPQPFKGS